MLAHGSQVRKRAVDIQALRQVWIAEVNQANKRNWDFRSYSQLLRPRHLLDGILGDEFVPDEAVYLPRAGCSEIIIEKVSPWQRGVVPNKSFKSRVLPCKNTVVVGSAVVEMSVCIDDCGSVGERGRCHLLGQTLPSRAHLQQVYFASMSGHPGYLAVKSRQCHVWTAPSWQGFFLHARRLVGAAMCSACLCGSHDRWP